jgi:phage shock protein PspC (stress-responsive transcriptional regulator)
MQVNRRLYRCRHDRRLAGVAAGVAEYFELDPTLVRVLWFLSIFAGGLGILLYIGMAIIVPLEPLSEADAAQDAASLPEGHRHMNRGSGRFTTFVGIALILFGALALLDALLPAWTDSWRYLWPAFLVGIGVLLVLGAIRREPTNL